MRAAYNPISLALLILVMALVLTRLPHETTNALEDTPPPPPVDTGPTAAPAFTPTLTLTTVPPTATDAPILPEPEETIAPADVPLSTETAVPTGTITESAPDATVTSENIIVPTTATDQAAVTPTSLPAEPPLILVWNETFASGDLSAWQLTPQWSLIDVDGNTALQISESASPTQVELLIRNDLGAAAQVRFRAIAATASLSMRCSAAGCYTVTVSSDGLVNLYRANQPLQSAVITAFSSDVFHTLRLSTVDNILRISVDGMELMTILDDAPLPPGTLVLGAQLLAAEAASGPTRPSVTYDDITLWLPADAPLPTVTPAATGIVPTEAVLATMTAQPTATAQPLAAEPPLSLIFTDNFDAGESILWTLGEGWSYVSNENGQALQAVNAVTPVSFANHDVFDAAVAARFLINAGVARLSTRVSAAGSYTAELHGDGTVNLYRGDVLLGTAAVPALTPAAWVELRLSVFGDVARVIVDDSILIAIRDSDPLAAGTVTFSAWNLVDNNLIVDDFSLWVSTTSLGIVKTQQEEVPLEPPMPIMSQRALQSRNITTVTQSNRETIVNEVHAISTVQDFLDAITLANSNPSELYVLFMDPGIYTVPSNNNQGLEITGQVVIVGNLGASVNSPDTPENAKVVFQPQSGQGVFFPYPGTLTLYNVVIQGGNAAPAHSGGAIYNWGTTKIYNSLLRNNRAYYWGGAIYNGGGRGVSAEIINTVFEANSTTSTYSNIGGGAITTQYGASLSVACSTFVSNDSASWGGVLFVYDNPSADAIRLSQEGNTHNNFLTNTAYYGYGAIYNPASITVEAANQYWSPAPSTVRSQTNSVFGANFTPVANEPAILTCEVPPIPAAPPSWTEDGMVVIHPNEPIPELNTENIDPCERTNQMSSRLPCATQAYNEYRAQLGGSMTWAQVASLVMYAEGNALLLGNLGSGTLTLQNPQSSGLGTCWRLTGTETWNDGLDQCNIVNSQSAPGVQNDFVYAVWEWLFKECAIKTGFVDANGVPDYEKDGQHYNGECTQEGLLSFLSQMHALYTDTTFSHDPNLYLSRAQTEYALWGNNTNPYRYSYGQCPCTWGNVAYESPEDVPDQTERERSARRNDGSSPKVSVKTGRRDTV